MSYTQEPSSCSFQKERVNFTQGGDGEVARESAVSESNNNIEQDPMDAVRKDIISLKSFQETVAKKLYELEKALKISQQTNPNSSIGNVETGDEICNCNGKSDFTLNLFKIRITNLENEILKKGTIIDYLTKQLFASKSNSRNDKTNLQKDNTNEANKNKTSHDKTRTKGNNENNSKRKVVATRDSMLNGINESGLSKYQNVKIQNFPGGTIETILDKVETLVAEKPDCIIIHAETNDIMNGINSLNSVKKIVKKVKQTSPNTKVAFSSLITRQDNKDLDKKVQDVNNRLKNYCSQTNIEYIENSNIKEEHLGKKKLHLHKRVNTIFASNLLKF